MIPSFHVNGCPKMDAAGNVTLNGYPSVAPARYAASRAAGESIGRSRSTTSCTDSGTSSPRALWNETTLSVRMPSTAS